MAHKAREVMTPAPVALPAETPLTEAAKRMRDQGIGAVLVHDETRLRGLVTDRDIVIRAIAEDKSPAATTLGAICSADLVTVGPDEPTGTVVRLMRENAVRRIPVVEDGQAIGILSLGDLALEHDERSALADVSAAPPNV
ncbi:MAG TPA: CBS domain-containing protein [Streptosporangiaceae bacterium]|jgi:CBS domain-containing protein|nr:CBS domain-containing protein [Streptosporangiaceae bacterium]